MLTTKTTATKTEDTALVLLESSASTSLPTAIKRLLPSISMIESTGGKEARNNNMFGWDNGNVRFSTNRDGIHRVASRLAESRYYKGKTLDQTLRTYNPVGEYGKKVKLVMAQLGPANLAPSGVF